ncbi:two pore domain potassium channel number 2 [Plakobranchus ocellatus]|uniref:Two pore domain potassium channel number 2 n=1 Tax=Plakobranchus ocellatus TaxID=259542 RepID=A0AAV4APY4_9GAST|nr:two pore domain potassium channel number 2 [Plakobranchus ocellatus]
MAAVQTHSEGISISAILEGNATGNSSLLDDDSVVISSKWDIASGFLFCITIISTIAHDLRLSIKIILCIPLQHMQSTSTLIVLNNNNTDDDDDDDDDN